MRLILIGVGLFFLVLSAAGAILELANEVSKGPESDPLDGITKLIEALGVLWQVFAAAPLWLGLAGVGVLIILLGAFLPLKLRN